MAEGRGPIPGAGATQQDWDRWNGNANGNTVYRVPEGYYPAAGYGINQARKVQPDAANANQYLSMFNLAGTGLSQGQQDALAASGYNTGLGAVSDWQKNKDPFVLDSQIPLMGMVANETRLREVLGLNQLHANLAQQQFNTTGEYIRQNNANVMSSYDTARNELSMAGQGAITGLLSREKQAIAGTQQQMQSRGLGNTTIMDNARQGVQRRTSQDIAGVQEQVGAQRSALAQDRAKMEFAAGQNMSEFMKYRTRYEGGLLDQRGGILSSVIDNYKANAPQQNDKDNTGQALQTAAMVAAVAAAFV